MIKKSNTPKNNFWTSPFRIFAIFAIGIILPATLLGYLGFKSFQYESIVLKNQSEQRYSAVADSMRVNAGDFLLGLVDSLRVVSGSDAFQQWNVPMIITQLLNDTNLKGFPVKEFFVFDEQDQIVVPPLAREDAKVISSDVDWGTLANEINRLSKLEFVEKNIREALNGYIALRAKTLPDPLQAALLKYTANCYRKLNDNRSAESAYLDLIKRFDQTSDPVGYPEGIVGLQLLADFYEATGQNEKCVSMRLDLMEGILLSRWLLSRGQEQSLLKKTTDVLVQKISAATPMETVLRARWVRLQSLQPRLESLRSSAQNFLKTEWPDAIKRLRAQGWVDKGGVMLMGTQMMVVAPVWNPATHHRQGLLMGILEASTIRKAMNSILASQAQSVNLDFQWESASSPSSSQLGLTRSLEAISPPFIFKLLMPASDAQNYFLRRRMRAYGGMIGLSFIVIVIGLFVMFQALRREKENADLKAEFVANVSHELRTPLTAISYIGERLRTGRYRTPEEVVEFYAMLGEETSHLHELIEDILDFSKVMGGKKVYDKEKTSLRTVTQEAYDRFQVKAMAQGFSVALKLPNESVTLTIDAKAVRQAILNLLDNALKYSGDSRIIHLYLDVSPKEVVISVEDSGIGISPHEKENIFEKFYRVGQGAVRDTQGGVGLGLAMVKHIMEAHRGQVTFVSEKSKGTTFFLKFPMEEQR